MPPERPDVDAKTRTVDFEFSPLLGFRSILHKHNRFIVAFYGDAKIKFGIRKRLKGYDLSIEIDGITLRNPAFSTQNPVGCQSVAN